MTNSPLAGLLARTGGVRGLIYTALPVTTFAVASAVGGLVPAIIASLAAATIVLVSQLVRRESTRPALWGFTVVALCAALAFITGKGKDFYLPGIWMYLMLAVVFTVSVLIRRPVVGVAWAWATGRDGTWRQVPRVRLAFDIVTAVMAAVSWTRFVVQNHLYATDQDGLLAVARIAMGWPLFVVTTSAALLAIRYAIRALPRVAESSGI